MGTVLSKELNLNILSNQEDLIKNLKPFFDILEPGDVVLLSGSIGAGKTTLVKTFVDFKRQFEEKDKGKSGVMASSPSYNLIHEYQFKDFKVVHIDLYRIESDEDLESTGFWDIMQSKNSLFFIEWPDKINPSDLHNLRKVNIEIQIKGEEREFQIEIQ